MKNLRTVWRTVTERCPECGVGRQPGPSGRWEDMKIVRWFGWIEGRCPNCGARNP